jgi:hypothetical protein
MKKKREKITLLLIAVSQRGSVNLLLFSFFNPLFCPSAFLIGSLLLLLLDLKNQHNNN